MIWTALGTEIVDEAILTKEFANFLSMPKARGSILAALTAFNLFIKSGISKEVGMVGIAIFLSLHDRYGC